MVVRKCPAKKFPCPKGRCSCPPRKEAPEEKVPDIYVGVTSIAILRGRGMDKVTLTTLLPCPAPEYFDEKFLHFQIQVPKPSTIPYLKEHFAGVPCEMIDMNDTNPAYKPVAL